MPRIINGGKEIEFDDGTRMPVPRNGIIRCPKCGAQINQSERSSAGCLLTWIVILIVIGAFWLMIALQK